MAVIGILIKLDSPGPVFYRQVRVGLRARPYMMWKFRSMFTDAEKEGARWASEEDSRISRVGRYLRKWRLDEIPQLMNVIRGEMSLVGPRPERPVFVQELRSAHPLLRPSAYRQAWDYGLGANAISLRGFDRRFACETAVRSVLCEIFINTVGRAHPP